ncbi:hypothetical protein JCM3765_000839 [Sporobolomyces pararoseus]
MDLLNRIVPPRDHIDALGPVQGLISPLILISLLLSPPSRLLNSTLLPLFIFSALFTSLWYTTGSAPDDYGRASLQFTLVLRAIDAFLLSTPSFELAFKRSKKDQVLEPWTLKRLGWTVKWIATMRGAGWVWQIVPEKSSAGGGNAKTKMTRWQYLRSRFKKLSLTYLTLDATSTYMQSRPYFHRAVSFSNLSRTESLVNSIAACASAALALNTSYQILCLVCVSSRLWAPEECIDLFGDWRDSKSLAGFWGKTWHQSFRRPFVSISNFLAGKLSQKLPSSPSSSYRTLTVFFAFSLSALLHAFASFAMNRSGGGSLKFFLVQPFGILFEWIVARSLGQNDKDRVLISLIGYVWTASWLLYWSPWFFDELVQAGFWEVDPAPLSVVRGFWKGDWWNT